MQTSLDTVITTVDGMQLDLDGDIHKIALEGVVLDRNDEPFAARDLDDHRACVFLLSFRAEV